MVGAAMISAYFSSIVDLSRPRERSPQTGDKPWRVSGADQRGRPGAL